MARSIKKGPYVFERLLKKVQKLNEEGVTVVMITHDANIAAHAKRVLHIFDGEIAEDVERKRKEAEQNEQSVEAPL